MVVTDPIADFLTRIRNANMVFMDKVEIPASKTKLALANILKDEGFIKDVEYIEDGNPGSSASLVPACVCMPRRMSCRRSWAVWASPSFPRLPV